MNKQAKAHLVKAEDYLLRGEDFYRAAAGQIEAALEADPSTTQREIAAELGRSTSYVSALVKAASRVRDTGEPFRIDWQSGATRRNDILERTKPADLVKAVQKAIKEAPPEERAKIVQTLTSPSTAAGRHISNTVAERETAAKRKQAERAAVNRNMGGVPLPALWASMVIKLDEWKRGMAVFTDDDLHELAAFKGHGLERVVQEVEGLNDETHRWLDLLGSARPNLRVIEGKSSRRTA